MARDCAISRRSVVAAGGALAGLAALGAAAAPQFSVADDDTAYEEGVSEVWGHCAINCPAGCPVKLHVKDGEVLWCESYNNPTNDLDDPQPRCCLRGRSYRRWMNDPDRLSYPLKRAQGTKRGEGKYEQIGWDVAVRLIAENLRRVIDTYGNQAVFREHPSDV